MKNRLLLPIGLLALSMLAALGAIHAAQAAPVPKVLGSCGCQAPSYVRLTSSATIADETFVEVDTDAGPLTVTLPPAPAALRRLEVWLGQGGTPATIDPNGFGVQGPVDLVLDQDHETVELLFVVPIPGSPGYWRVRAK